MFHVARFLSTFSGPRHPRDLPDIWAKVWEHHADHPWSLPGYGKQARGDNREGSLQNPEVGVANLSPVAQSSDFRQLFFFPPGRGGKNLEGHFFGRNNCNTRLLLIL